MFSISASYSTLFSCALLLVMMTSCQQEQTITPDQALTTSNFIHDKNEDGHVHLPPQPFNAEVEAHVDDHSVNMDMIEEVQAERPDGTTEELFLVDGCIEMTKSQVNELTEIVASGEKQYRTFSLVSSPRVIRVIGYTGGSYALTNKMRTALSWAINNYNALPLGLTFSLSYAASTNADIVVYQNPYNTGAGGVAGFPSGGNPYKWVQIYSGMENYSTNVNEHVMTHEIGHCLGLRHTDYFNRASCGQNSNEGSAGVGAIHIPGTPTGIDWNSVMLACFSSSEDGEFGPYDRIALQYLY